MDRPLSAGVPQDDVARACDGVVTVRMERIAAGGDGVGRDPDGRVVFVPRTAPGDVVEAQVVRARPRWAHGRLRRLRERGPARVDAPCPLYARCGGCQLQHLRYDAQLEAKAAIVRDALARIGGFGELPELDIVPSARELRYRNRVTLTLERSGEDVRAGYRALDDPDAIVDVGDCPLAEAPIGAAWTRLRDAWGPGAALLPAGRRLRLTLRASEEGAVGLIVQGGRSPWKELEALREAADLAAIWWIDAGGRLRAQAGPGALAERWAETALPLTADAFLQVNRPVAAALEAFVLQVSGDAAGLRVVDAYSGVGLRALELARRGARVVGIESSSRAVHAAETVAREQGLALRFRHARVERALAWELPADLVILNPPREGTAPEVCETLRTRPPARILYVSCDPSTLARDLRRLGALYRLAGARAFDMFPQTAHVETVVHLEAGRA